MKNLNTKFLVTISIVFFSFFFAIPALFQNYKILPKFIDTKSIRLGLDLQGGSQLLLQIETREALREKLLNLSEDVRVKLEDNKILTDDISVINNEVKITLNVKNEAEKALKIINDFESVKVENENFLIKLNFDEKYINEFYSSLVIQSLEIIRKRINSLHRF